LSEFYNIHVFKNAQQWIVIHV